MKRRPIRVAHLMIALVVLAALIEGSGVGPRWRGYYRRARQEARQTEEYLLASRRFEAEAAKLKAAAKSGGATSADGLRGIRDAEYQADGFRQLAAWSERKGENYRRALLRPWAPADPDPSFVSRRLAPAPAAPPPR